MLVQHLVSSLSLGDCSDHTLGESSRPLLTCSLNSHLKRVTIPDEFNNNTSKCLLNDLCVYT